jgi:aminoglycoside 3-N-acetyltransferase I
MNILYKLLSGSDVPLFKELLTVFGDSFEEPQTYQDAIPSDAYLTSLLEKNHFIALLALDENKVVGGLAAYILDKFEQERNEVYIYDLAVSRDHRRQGIAKSVWIG